jgi:hypothetical protein
MSRARPTDSDVPQRADEIPVAARSVGLRHSAVASMAADCQLALPSRRRATKRRRSPISELAFHGIHALRSTLALPLLPDRSADMRISRPAGARRKRGRRRPAPSSARIEGRTPPREVGAFDTLLVVIPLVIVEEQPRTLILRLRNAPRRSFDVVRPPFATRSAPSGGTTPRDLTSSPQPQILWVKGNAGKRSDRRDNEPRRASAIAGRAQHPSYLP